MSLSLSYDASYAKSLPGSLKISCLLCCFIGFLCIMFSSVHYRNFRGAFYITIATLAFICTVCVLLARLFQLWQRKFYDFDAITYEFYLHAVLAFAFFVASGVALSLDVVAYSLAAFFGLAAFGFYALDAYLGYRLSRQKDVATQTQNI